MADYGKRPKEGALHCPDAARTSLIPASGLLARSAESTDNVPRREHPATREAPGLARRSSGSEPAFRRPGSVCPPGRRHPGASGPVPPLAAASGAPTPACGLQPLTCLPPRSRPCSERSSPRLQRAPETQRPYCAPARPRPPDGPPLPAHWLPARDGPCPLAVLPPLQTQGGAQAPHRSQRPFLGLHLLPLRGRILGPLHVLSLQFSQSRRDCSNRFQPSSKPSQH